MLIFFLILGDNEYCENLGPNSCPSKSLPQIGEYSNSGKLNPGSIMDDYFGKSASSYDDIFRLLLEQIVSMSAVIAYTLIAGFILLIFLLSQRCMENRSREQTLLSKLNCLERSHAASLNECEKLTNLLTDMKAKYTSIKNNTFGSNEMVVSLQQDLDGKSQQCVELQEQVAALEKVTHLIIILGY